MEGPASYRSSRARPSMNSLRTSFRHPRTNQSSHRLRLKEAGVREKGQFPNTRSLRTSARAPSPAVTLSGEPEDHSVDDFLKREFRASPETSPRGSIHRI